MTDEELQKCVEFYKLKEKRALAQKRCVTCKYYIPTLPFSPYPPLCEFGGEATCTCDLYKVNEEYRKRSNSWILKKLCDLMEWVNEKIKE